MQALRAAAWLPALVLALSGCASLPSLSGQVPSIAYTTTDTGQTRLARALAGVNAAHPGKTGVRALPHGREAFAARALLARSAERSLDLQYYIWRNDTSGGLLAQELWLAAERGVRVRLLLDDINTSGMDTLLAVLDAHPHIEVRLFNPFAGRSARIAGLMGDFSRLHRRMHNKSFTADNQLSVVGGRNIGDAYMGAEVEVEFADLDVVTAGAVVPDISASFDAYWNSPSAYPADSLLPSITEAEAAAVRTAWDKLRSSPLAAAYLAAVNDMGLVRDVMAGTLELEWVDARLVSDDPAKVLEPPEHHATHMLPHLEAALGRPEREMLLVSPYFVPGRQGTETLVALAARGVKVAVLTNSLSATDVGAVYAGYARYRRDLLRGGVRIYELKRTAPPRAKDDARREKRGTGGSSGASLHAKTFGVDGRRIFVGSFNLDPRSIRLNTEMGVVLDSPVLAGRLTHLFEADVSTVAYELRLATDGSVVWAEQTPAGEVVHTRTPETGVLRLLGVSLLSVLPIEWLL